MPQLLAGFSGITILINLIHWITFITFHKEQKLETVKLIFLITNPDLHPFTA